MNFLTAQSLDWNQMMNDAATFFAHVSPARALYVLIGVMAALYLFTKEKSALIVALTGVLYMLPFVLAGKMP